jgi:nitrogen fixation/metabolism regulation signal transduction histidine kinase
MGYTTSRDREILEPSDYFIMAIMSAILCIGLLITLGSAVSPSTVQDQVAYGVAESLYAISLILTIAFLVGGTVKKLVKRKRTQRLRSKFHCDHVLFLLHPTFLTRNVRSLPSVCMFRFLALFSACSFLDNRK